MATQTFNAPETRVNAGVTLISPALSVAGGYAQADISARLVSRDWLAMGATPTGTVTLAFQESLDGGVTWREFDRTTWPNTRRARDGGMPGVQLQYIDGLARQIRVLVTPSLRMFVGCDGMVTTTL